jgi:hypothetical protein
MTKENYQNDCYNFDNLVKSIIYNSGIEINLDSDFSYKNQSISVEEKYSKLPHKLKRFKKFLEMCKKRKNKLVLPDNNQQKKEELKEELKDNFPLPLTLSLIHSVVEKNKTNEKYYKRFMIPLHILMGFKNNRTPEYAYDNIILEKDCQYGLYCPYKCEPLKCPYNHHEMSYKMIDNSKTIIQGDQIPNIFCIYERPWKLYRNTNKPVRCTNPYCWYNHAIGRAELIINNGYYKYTNA